MTEEVSKILLDNDFDIEYVGEGAANVVFRLIRREPVGLLPSASAPAPLNAISHSSHTAPTLGHDENARLQLDAASHGMPDFANGGIPPTSVTATHQDVAHSLPLLRLRKDLATVTPILDAHRDQQRMILPHFDGGDLVGSSLAALPAELVERCNSYLLDLEESGIRPKKRRGSYLAHQPYANLVQDMSARDADDTVIEFKPKWLVQSASAPADAKRCRTCALRAMRREKLAGAPVDDGSAFCPLDLSSHDARFVHSVLTGQLRHLWKPPRSDAQVEGLAAAVTRHLAQSQVIRKIRQLQLQMDPSGVLQAKVDSALLMAMTLRDCTLFVRVDGSLHVEARIGDIDLKPATKSSYWRLTEQRLIEEGWYTCTEGGMTGSSDAVCALSR